MFNSGIGLCGGLNLNDENCKVFVCSRYIFLKHYLNIPKASRTFEKIFKIDEKFTLNTVIVIVIEYVTF